MTSSSPSFSVSSSSDAWPAPLVPLVWYNHELLKLRLLSLHSDWLYRYKLSTERSIDEQRKAEFTRGHSLHIPGFSLSTFPIRRIHSANAAQPAQQQREEEERKEEQEQEELQAVSVLDAQQLALRITVQSGSKRRTVMPGSSLHLFRSEEEAREEREDDAEQRRRQGEDRQRRAQRWKSRLAMRVQQLLSPSPRSAPPSPSAAASAASASRNGVSRLNAAAGTKEDKVEEQQHRVAPFTPARASASVSAASTAAPPSLSVSAPSPSVPAAGRSSSPASFSKSPSPPPFPASSASSLPPSVAFCEECANRIETAWSVCDYCGYDPLAAGDDDDDGAGGKRRKRKRAQRLESLIAQTQQVERKQKAQEEMRLLAESMSPWSSEDAAAR